MGMLDPDAPIEEVGQRVLTSFKQAEEVNLLTVNSDESQRGL